MITKHELRRARRKRRERRRKIKKFAIWAAGTTLVVAGLGASFFVDDDRNLKNMRCVRLEVDETDREACVEWERQKTVRSAVIGGKSEYGDASR